MRLLLAGRSDFVQQNQIFHTLFVNEISHILQSGPLKCIKTQLVVLLVNLP